MKRRDPLQNAIPIKVESGLHRCKPLPENDVIERVVKELNTICSSTALDLALRVGKCVIEGIYSRDISRFRSRDRKGNRALRKLADHPSLLMSHGALYRSVAIYELCERLGPRTWQNISSSHIRLVLPLRSDEQERLLCEAETHGWSVQQLDEQIAHLNRTPTPGRGGRKRLSRRRKTMRVVARALDSLLRQVQEDDNSANDASPESTREAARLLDRTEIVRDLLRDRVLVPRASNAESPAADRVSRRQRRTP